MLALGLWSSSETPCPRTFARCCATHRESEVIVARRPTDGRRFLPALAALSQTEPVGGRQHVRLMFVGPRPEELLVFPAWIDRPLTRNSSCKPAHAISEAHRGTSRRLRRRRPLPVVLARCARGADKRTCDSFPIAGWRCFELGNRPPDRNAGILSNAARPQWCLRGCLVLAPRNGRWDIAQRGYRSFARPSRSE